ncbi:helix-turn-helix domain-containing protein [Thalassovita sp.]|uniref:helix-turn-helix domain-containing protein n=1 Tax=Thalassovita sp. TaxID=1979401 RepID=UPI003B5CF889
MRAQNGSNIEKLVEHRTAHYTAHSEMARYFTNTPASVLLRFATPSVCRLNAGKKVMRVGGDKAFEFFPGDALYVPPDTDILIDLSAAGPDTPITCDNLEIETGRMDRTLARLNESLSAKGSAISAHIDWSRYVVMRGSEANSLRLPSLMALFQQDEPMFRDLRIEAQIDEMLLTLLHKRSRDLLDMKESDAIDNGIMAAVREIRKDLSVHISNEDLARIACMSESSLFRNFRRQFGVTPARFANQLRITAARRILSAQVTRTIESIAFDLGFSSASHFAKVFRQITGETPTAFRDRRTHAVHELTRQSRIEN